MPPSPQPSSNGPSVAAIDTSVLVRFLAQDDPEQAARARDLVEGEPVWVPLTVLLETEWVLRRLLGRPRTQILQLLAAFAGLPNVTVENPARLAQALMLAETGMDFADALHLAATPEGEGFATYDADLIRRARQAGLRAFAP